MSRAALRWARALTRLRRGGNKGHRARALLNAARHAVVWRGRLARIRRAHPGRPVILVALTEHMGDIVAADPIMRELRRENPDAFIVRAVRDVYRELVDHDPAVDAVWTVGCVTEWAHVRDMSGFDRVLNLHLDGHSCARCREPIRRRDGNPDVNARTYYHHGSLLDVFCKAAGIPLPEDRAPRVHVPPAAAARVDALALPSRFVAIHCTSNQDVRDWSAGKWRALAEAVTAAGLPVVEIGLRPVVGGRVPGCIDLCGRLSILETAEVIRRSVVFAGIDSGPAHLANATGVPGVILLGHYRRYERYMPYSGAYADGSNAEVIQWDGPAADIPVQEALRALGRFVPELRTRDRPLPPKPLVSVVIPTYSHRETIGETLDSVFAQTFRDFEVVVVDDGSTDGTADLLRPLVEAGRIRYVRQENAGQAAARNRGLSEARGTFIAFLDDDDLWPQDKLEWQVEALRERPDAVLAFGEERKLQPDGSLTGYMLGEPPDGEAYRKFRLRNWITSPGQTLIRADVLRELGGFDTSIWGSDDWDLYIRLARRGPFVFRPVVALHYRLHGGNASAQAVRHARNHLSVVRRHIGWNLPLLLAHQRLAARYFVPNLMAFIRRARDEGDTAGLLAAAGLALTFRGRLVFRRAFLGPVLKETAAALHRRRGAARVPPVSPELLDRRNEAEE